MRKLFASMLFDEMAVNKDIYLITGDLGYGLWDSVKESYPDRFFNVGSAEMSMMGLGIGLAMDGKIPYVYSITPFAIYRPFEMIRNYLNHESIPVNVIGGGRDEDYGYLGFSHWSSDDETHMSGFTNMKCFKPRSDASLKLAFNYSLLRASASYINLKR